jgi:hypothetical protein
MYLEWRNYWGVKVLRSVGYVSARVFRNVEMEDPAPAVFDEQDVAPSRP